MCLSRTGEEGDAGRAIKKKSRRERRVSRELLFVEMHLGAWDSLFFSRSSVQTAPPFESFFYLSLLFASGVMRYRTPAHITRKGRRAFIFSPFSYILTRAKPPSATSSSPLSYLSLLPSHLYIRRSARFIPTAAAAAEIFFSIRFNRKKTFEQLAKNKKYNKKNTEQKMTRGFVWPATKRARFWKTEKKFNNALSCRAQR